MAPRWWVLLLSVAMPAFTLTLAQVAFQLEQNDRGCGTEVALVGDWLQQYFVESILRCASHCLAMSQCLSINHNAITGECQILGHRAYRIGCSGLKETVGFSYYELPTGHCAGDDYLDERVDSYGSCVCRMTPSAVNAQGIYLGETGFRWKDQPLSSCYKIFTRGRRWTHAKEKCAAMGAHLVAIETTSEHDSLKAHLQKRKMRERIWVGANDLGRTRGDFVWDGVGGVYSLPSAYWGHDQPSLPKEHERCVCILNRQDWKFGDLACVKPFSFICEN